MGSAPSFGRRVTLEPTEQKPRPQAAPAAPLPGLAAALATARAEPIRLSAADALSPDIDRELEEWKRTRGTRIPWRQIWLIASLSFAIAWAVLPDSVNDLVNWVLLGLSAASFVSGVVPRNKGYLAGAGAAGGGGTNDPAGPGNSTGLS
jgi:hypothetical protein